MENKKTHDLCEIARIAMIERGFAPDFEPEVLEEVAALKPLPPLFSVPFRDLRDRLWVSIDNDDSRDLDQLTYAEEGKAYVAIADVDALVKPGTAIDAHAGRNTTSVYCPGRVFPMLPPELSNDLTSLNPGEDRRAIVVEISVGTHGAFDLADLYPAWVKNKAKLAYNSIGAWLEGKKEIPLASDLQKQLRLQDHIAQSILRFREAQGSLQFADLELEPVMVEGKAVSIRERTVNRAHRLIENMMIAANVAATRYLEAQGLPTLRRIVRSPKRWDRIVSLAKSLGERLPSRPNAIALQEFLRKQQQIAPEQFANLSQTVIKLIGRGEYVLGKPGDRERLLHFNLAESEYSHSTAPNRRYPDLIVQRLLKSPLFSTPLPYTEKELRAIAARCTEKEGDAHKVERRLIKCAAAMLMADDIGKTYPATVTGAAPKGTWVRLRTSPRIEGKLTRGFEGVDVGDQIEVKLLKVDVLNGHIDFGRRISDC